MARFERSAKAGTSARDVTSMMRMDKGEEEKDMTDEPTEMKVTCVEYLSRYRIDFPGRCCRYCHDVFREIVNVIVKISSIM